MTVKYHFRPFHSEYTEKVSRLIISALEKINASYYPPDIINFMKNYYSPDNLIKIVEDYESFIMCLTGKTDALRLVGVGGWKRFYTTDRKMEVGIGLRIDAEYTGYIGTMFVEPGFVGKGIGTLILNRLLHEVKKAGLRYCYLEAAINAEKFYRRHGFRTMGVKVREGFGKTFTMLLELEEDNDKQKYIFSKVLTDERPY